MVVFEQSMHSVAGFDSVASLIDKYFSDKQVTVKLAYNPIKKQVIVSGGSQQMRKDVLAMLGSLLKNKTPVVIEESVGHKMDEDKPRMDLIPLVALAGAGMVLGKAVTSGKYPENNWKLVPNGYARYKAALLRHLYSIDEGDEIDNESGLYHIDHAMCCMLFMSYLKRQEINSRTC